MSGVDADVVLNTDDVCSSPVPCAVTGQNKGDSLLLVLLLPLVASPKPSVLLHRTPQIRSRHMSRQSESLAAAALTCHGSGATLGRPSEGQRPSAQRGSAQAKRNPKHCRTRSQRKEPKVNGALPVLGARVGAGSQRSFTKGREAGISAVYTSGCPRHVTKEHTPRPHTTLLTRCKPPKVGRH